MRREISRCIPSPFFTDHNYLLRSDPEPKSRTGETMSENVLPCQADQLNM